MQTKILAQLRLLKKEHSTSEKEYCLKNDFHEPDLSDVRKDKRQYAVYTYFKKRCRRERRMVVAERKLHNRKVPWFHIWYAKTMSSLRGANLSSLSN